VGDVGRFEADLLEAFRSEYRDLLDHIRIEKTVPDGLLDAIQAVKDRFVAAGGTTVPAADPRLSDAEGVDDATSDKTLATE
jgi:hypothetical protein